MKYVIIDERTPEKAVRTLIDLGYTPLSLPPFSRLAAPVASHPDMLLFLGDAIFCNRDYYAEAKDALDAVARASGLSIVLGDEEIGKCYPCDIAYNAARIGDHLFGKLSCLAPNLLEYAKRASLAAVDVKQGYAKCSVCTVSERAAISSDPSMEKALLMQGFDVLRIDSGHVALSGYDCGFIGGASGTDGERVFFCGSLDSHPCAEEIKAFCRSHGKIAVSLSDEPLYDVGTMIFFQGV